MRPPSAHPESARPAPRVMVAAVAAVGEPMFSALEEAFFAAGTELSAVSVAPLDVFAEAQEAVYAILDRYSLADVVQNRPQLVQLLRVGPRS